MKVSKNLFAVVAAVMIIIAIVGPLDQRAHTFIKGATEKTMKFHSLISDVKMVLAGLSKINIPFISGHTDELGESLNKAKDYLLKISAIVFSQLMLLSISQTWIFKILLILLFVLYILRKSSLLAAKFLIMFLAINPGLSIYSSGVEFISQKSSIDFGKAYLTKLEAQVTAIKKEKSQLMEQHEQQRAQIRNGEKHVNIFGKLKEDVSYDFKKVGDDVKGGFSHIRLLIHEAGHEMTMKVYNFCTMILFSFLLLPLGYALIIYVLYKNMFHSVSVMVEDGKQLLHEGENEIKGTPLTTRVANAIKAAWQELIAMPEKMVSDIEHKTENIDSDIHNRITNIHKEFQNEIQQIKSDIHAKVTHGEGKLEGDIDEVRNTIIGKVHQEESKIETDATQTADTVKGKIDEARDSVRDKVDQVDTDVKSDLSTVKDKVLGDAHNIEGDIHQKTDNLKQHVEQGISNVEGHIEASVENVQQHVTGDIHSEETQVKAVIDDANTLVSREEHTAEGAVQNVSSSISSDAQNVSRDVRNEADDIHQSLESAGAEVKGHVEDSITSAEDDVNTAKEHLKSDVQDLAGHAKDDVDTIKKKIDGGDGPIISI